MIMIIGVLLAVLSLSTAFLHLRKVIIYLRKNKPEGLRGQRKT
jgi:hypothetical protein